MNLHGTGSFREMVELRLEQALDQNVTPEECDWRADNIEKTLEKISAFSANSRDGWRPEFSETMLMILTARAWRTVARHLRNLIAYLSDEEDDSESEALLAETGSVSG